jgi:hypothetical protein
MSIVTDADFTRCITILMATMGRGANNSSNIKQIDLKERTRGAMPPKMVEVGVWRGEHTELESKTAFGAKLKKDLNGI